VRFQCSVCAHIYDEKLEGTSWGDLPDDWVCPICGADKSYFEPMDATAAGGGPPTFRSPVQPVAVADADIAAYLEQWRRPTDDLESTMAAIQQAAISGETVIEPMRSRKSVVSWDEILIQGAQLARLPLNEDRPVSTRTVIGRSARHPLVLDTPVYVSHMSFGALSREATIALAKGTAAAGTAVCSGEGGILPESLAAAHRYIFEYVPNRYSVTDENLRSADAVEIKFGQSAKPGLGGHLPGSKVTEEIAAIRGFPAGRDIISPAHFADITNIDELRAKVELLRGATGGKPIGIKLAAGHIEADLAVALAAGPDFVTIDGRAGGTGASPKVVKDSSGIPTIYALARARRYLDERGAAAVSLVITGGLRLSSDVAKALAMGADAVAIATAALIAAGCQQYRICHTGRCPVGITTHDPALRARLDVELSARRVANFLRVTTVELQAFARLTGHDDIHQLSVNDLRTTSSEIANHTSIAHVGEPERTG
jgi:glutamate synthase domain-containing protein 2/rubredoxin